MHRFVLVTVVVFAVGLPLPAAAQSIAGAWRQVEMEVIGGSNAGTTDTEDRGILWVFTDGYSSLNAPGDSSERPNPSDPPTTEEMAQLYQSYVAFAGPYEFDGSILTWRLEAKLDPSAADMLSRGINLTDTTLESRATDPNGVVILRRYVRVD